MPSMREARPLGGRTPEAGGPTIDRGGAIAPLRLAIGKDGLGIELARTAVVECLDVVELVVRLPHVKFPFDVSGGVAKFRHKRGELERVAVELDARRVARWAEPRLRGLLSPGPCTVVVEPRAFGATMTIHARSNPSAAACTRAAPGARVRRRDRPVARRRGVGRARSARRAPRRARDRARHPRGGHAARRRRATRGSTLLDGRCRRAAWRAPSCPRQACGPRARPACACRARARATASSSSPSRAHARPARDQRAAPGNEHHGARPDEATLAAEAALLTREGDDARMARDLDRARQLDLGGARARASSPGDRTTHRRGRSRRRRTRGGRERDAARDRDARAPRAFSRAS